MKEYLEEIEGWMSQVRDEEKSVEDYDFLDRLSHGGKDGNNGLANAGTHLAVYEEDGELEVDRELLEELDSRQEQGGSRHSNIAYRGETQKRDGNTLKDRYEEGDRRLGHSLLQDMVDDFREHGDMDAETPKEANTIVVEDYESGGPMTFTLNTADRGDSHMTEDNEDNTYDKAIEKLDTLGGIAFAAASPINVPATIVGVGVDHLQGNEEGQKKGTEIDVEKALSEDRQKDISERRDSNMKGQKDGYRVEGQDEDLYSENLEDENFNGSMEVVHGRGHTYEDPAELAAAAEEGELGVDRFLEIAGQYDLEDDEEAYLVGQGAKMLAEDMAQELNTSVDQMLQRKYVLDDVMDSIEEDMELKDEAYVNDLEEMAAGFASVYRNDSDSKVKVEEARRNLEGLVRQGAEAVRESDADGLMDFRSTIQDALDDSS